MNQKASTAILVSRGSELVMNSIRPYVLRRYSNDAPKLSCSSNVRRSFCRLLPNGYRLVSLKWLIYSLYRYQYVFLDIYLRTFVVLSAVDEPLNDTNQEY